LLLAIVCPCCGHVGIAREESLPCDLVCWQCRLSRRIEPERAARIVSIAKREERISDFLNAAR
jgi:hypothetical protein